MRRVWLLYYIAAIESSECHHENNQSIYIYEYIQDHAKTVTFLEAAYSLLLLRRGIRGFAWFLMA